MDLAAPMLMALLTLLPVKRKTLLGRWNPIGCSQLLCRLVFQWVYWVLNSGAVGPLYRTFPAYPAPGVTGNAA